MDVKLGICNFCVPGTGVFAPQFVAQAGLDGMSIEFGTYENHFPTATRQVQDAYLEASEEFGIEYCNIGCSCFDNIPFVAHKGHAMYALIKEVLSSAVNTAAYMHIPMVFVPSFGVSSIITDEDMDNSVEMFKFMCDYAQEKGILVSSENHLPARKAIELVERVNKNNFSLFYDSNNYYYQHGYDQLDILKLIYPYIGNQLHVKDGTPGVLASSLLGEGSSGFFSIMNYLKEKNYKGWIIIENLYEKQPTNTFNTDVFANFIKDVEILKKSIN